MPLVVLVASSWLVMRAGRLAEEARALPAGARPASDRCTLEAERRVLVLECEAAGLLALDGGAEQRWASGLGPLPRAVGRLLSSPGLSGYDRVVVVVWGMEPGPLHITVGKADLVAWRQGALTLEEFFSRWQLEWSGKPPE
ncbi:MAG: hypothetical protein AB1446_02240 [Bacillota bacterium]